MEVDYFILVEEVFSFQVEVVAFSSLMVARSVDLFVTTKLSYS